MPRSCAGAALSHTHLHISAGGGQRIEDVAAAAGVGGMQGDGDEELLLLAQVYGDLRLDLGVLQWDHATNVGDALAVLEIKEVLALQAARAFAFWL
jgi:hypothetical protein